MANKGQAIRPEIFNLPSFQEEEEKTDTEVISEEEKILGLGADQAFWKTLKKHIDNVITELDQVNELAIANGSSMEEIGRNTIVVSLVKGVLKKTFDKVNDSKEALATQSNGK